MIIGTDSINTTLNRYIKLLMLYTVDEKYWNPASVRFDSYDNSKYYAVFRKNDGKYVLFCRQMYEHSKQEQNELEDLDELLHTILQYIASIKRSSISFREAKPLYSWYPDEKILQHT